MNKLTYVCLLIFLFALSNFARSGDVPANAYASGSNWYCNNGYKKVGDKCVKVNVPTNAYASGSNWYCNNGYKKIESNCIEMTEEEVQQQLKEFAIRRYKQKNKTIRYDSYEFTLRDIERKCEVYRYSENYGDVECRGNSLRIVERKCEAYFSGYGDKSGDLECSGFDLRPIENSCEAEMYSDNYAEISC